MKLIATSDFRNPDPLILEADDSLLHEHHIHKGCRFAIGGNLPFDKLSASQKRIVTELHLSGRIVEETQRDLVARIDAEVELEKKKTAPVVSSKK